MAIPIRITKPWRPLTVAEADKVAGNLGVYQLANDAGEIVYIGAATGRSLFGLRGEIQDKAANPPEGATQTTWPPSLKRDCGAAHARIRG